jgi:hypothetical protein
MFSHEYENSLIDDPKSPDFAISTGRKPLLINKELIKK